MKRRNIKVTSLPFSTAFLDLSNSNCRTLEFIRRFPRLTSINATNTLISDLKGVPLHSTVNIISVNKSPLASHEFYRLMLLCAINLNLKMIDGEQVTSSERDRASNMQVSVQPLLFEGFIITDLNPVTLTRGDETQTFDADDLVASTPSSLATMKARQTVDMMAELSRQLNSACLSMNVPHVQKTLPVDEMLSGEKPVDAVEILIDNVPEPARGSHVTASPFKRAFSENLKYEDDYLDKSVEVERDSPSKRALNETSQQLSISQTTPKTTPKRVRISPFPPRSPYGDLVREAVMDEEDVSVEKIFDIAGDFMGSAPASPEKAARFRPKEVEEKSASKIPVKADSPGTKNYGAERDLSGPIQVTRFGFTKQAEEILEEEEEEDWTTPQFDMEEEESKLSLSSSSSSSSKKESVKEENAGKVEKQPSSASFVSDEKPVEITERELSSASLEKADELQYLPLPTEQEQEKVESSSSSKEKEEAPVIEEVKQKEDQKKSSSESDAKSASNKAASEKEESKPQSSRSTKEEAKSQSSKATKDEAKSTSEKEESRPQSSRSAQKTDVKSASEKEESKPQSSRSTRDEEKPASEKEDAKSQSSSSTKEETKSVSEKEESKPQSSRSTKEDAKSTSEKEESKPQSSRSTKNDDKSNSEQEDVKPQSSRSTKEDAKSASEKEESKPQSIKSTQKSDTASDSDKKSSTESTHSSPDQEEIPTSDKPPETEQQETPKPDEPQVSSDHEGDKPTPAEEPPSIPESTPEDKASTKSSSEHSDPDSHADTSSHASQDDKSGSLLTEDNTDDSPVPNPPTESPQPPEESENEDSGPSSVDVRSSAGSYD